MFMRLEKINEEGKEEFINLILKGNTLLKTWGIEGENPVSITENTYFKQEIKNKKKSEEEVAKDDFNRIVKEKKQEGFKIVYFYKKIGEEEK